MVWVIWLDKQGKWHTWEEITINAFSRELAKISILNAEDRARRDAKMLVGEIIGTAEFIGSATVAYCVHSKKRYQAIKLAKGEYKNFCSRKLIE